jgi:small multidrug resistance pump
MFYWLLLYVAIIFEVMGTTAMKLSCGFKHKRPTIYTFVFYLSAVACLSISLKELEMGMAYAIWSGLGTLLVAVIGILHFDEQLSPLKIASLMLVITGVVGLNLSGMPH